MPVNYWDVSSRPIVMIAEFLQWNCFFSADLNVDTLSYGCLGHCFMSHLGLIYSQNYVVAFVEALLEMSKIPSSPYGTIGLRPTWDLFLVLGLNPVLLLQVRALAARRISSAQLWWTSLTNLLIRKPWFSFFGASCWSPIPPPCAGRPTAWHYISTGNAQA